MFIELGPFKETYFLLYMLCNVLYWWILVSWNQALTSTWQDAQVQRAIGNVRDSQWGKIHFRRAFSKFLEMFQTCSASQKSFEIGHTPYKFTYFLLEMQLNLDRCPNQLSKFGELSKSALQIWLPKDSWQTPDWLPTDFGQTHTKSNSRL